MLGAEWGLLARQSANMNIHDPSPGLKQSALADCITRAFATEHYIGPWILLSRTTWPQRAISLLSNARTAATVRWFFGSCDTTRSAHNFTIAGSAMISCSVALSLLTTSSGVPPG